MNDGLTLLYVEDNIIVQENFKLIFSKYFKNILIADNGRDALKLYQENSVDVAILDISIPEIDGLSVAHSIREKDKNIEIVMLTGHSEKEKLLKAINIHLFSYLVKPVKRTDLVENITRLLKKLSTKSTLDLGYNYTFDTKLYILKYKQEVIRLSKHEKKLLVFLSTHLDSYHSACDISNALFENENEEDTVCNSVIQLISRFKKKMLNSYNRESFFIENIYGLGYKINI